MDVLAIPKETVLQIALVSVVAYLLQKILRNTLLQGNVPPGPIGLPFFGYLPFLSQNRKEAFLKLSKKYGDIFSLRLGTELSVVLNTYDLVKEALSNPLSLGRRAETFAIVPEMGFVTSNGPEWHEQRAFCMQAMRDLGLGRGQWDTMIKGEIPSFLEALENFGGKANDPEPLITHTIGGNILSLLIGKRLEKGKDDDKIKLTHEFSQAISLYLDPANVVTSLPGMLSIFKKLKIAGYDKASSVMDKFLDLLRSQGLDVHKKNPEFKGANDFINLYLQKIENKSTQGGRHYFSEANALGNMLSLFLGGNDTIVASLIWLFRLMAKHPDIQKKVQAELDDVIGFDGSISYEERFKIPFTFAVLMESQRFSTIAPIPGPRQAIDDMNVGGYVIPKGANIFSNIWALHRDPKYWKYPHQFHPQHFLSEDGKKVLVSQPSFLPFTYGRRNCPGETVAWMEILNFFTAVMQRFNVLPTAGEKVTLDSVPGLVEALKSQKLCFIKRAI